MSLPPIDASFSWSTLVPSAVDPTVEAELVELHETLGVMRGAALAGVGTKPALEVPMPFQLAACEAGILNPGALLGNERYEHRTCGANGSLIVRVRSCDDLSGLCKQLLTELPPELGKSAAVMVSSSPLGPPKGSASTCADDEPNIVIWLLLDPLDVDCKQTTFVARPKQGAAASVVFDTLHKWAAAPGSHDSWQ